MKIVEKIWKLLKPSWRLRIIRATQAKFTVSVAAIITDREEKILLLEHRLRPGAGWGIPGGFIEHGEPPEAALRREIREETGIELETVKMLRVRTINRHIEILFRAEVLAGEKGAVRSREIKSLGWFTSDALPAEMSAVQKSMIEKVLRGEI